MVIVPMEIERVVQKLGLSYCPYPGLDETRKKLKLMVVNQGATVTRDSIKVGGPGGYELG